MMNSEFLAEDLSERKIRLRAVRLRVVDLFKQTPHALSLNDIEGELNLIVPRYSER